MPVIKLKKDPIAYIKKEYENMTKEMKMYKNLYRVDDKEKDKEIIAKIYKTKTLEAIIEMIEKEPDNVKNFKKHCNEQLDSLKHLKNEITNMLTLTLFNISSGCIFNSVDDFQIFIDSAIEIYKDLKSQI